MNKIITKMNVSCAVFRFTEIEILKISMVSEGYDATASSQAARMVLLWLLFHYFEF